MTRIADVVRVKEFAPVIDLAMADRPNLHRQLIDSYIVTEDLAELFVKILRSPLTAEGATMGQVLNRRSHLITAQYGAGKSYFLLMLGALLASLGDPQALSTVQARFSGFHNVLQALSDLHGRRFLVVRLDAKGCGDIPLRELLVREVSDAARKIEPGLELKSEYSAAADHLNRLHGTPEGERWAAGLKKTDGISIDDLRAGLVDLHRDSLAIYRRLYESVVHAIPPYTGLDLPKSFKSVLEQLKSHGYTDLVILVDEMTQYLQASKQHVSLTETLGVLESFAEFCNTGGNRCLLVAAMHRSLRRILKENDIDPDQREDWRKFVGRFDDHGLQFSDYETVLEQVFEIDNRIDGYLTSPVVRNQERDLQVTSRRLLHLPAGAPVPRRAYFPLHPVTLRYLRGVSERLGQEKRTAFSFIKDRVKSILQAEELLVDERLNVLGPDLLFDYFLPDLDQQDDIGIIYAFNSVRDKLTEDHLALRAFKALAMQYCAQTALPATAPGAVGQGMSIRELADVLNVADAAELQTSLDLLEGLRPQTVFHDQALNQYWFVPGGGLWDVDAEIEHVINDSDPVKELRKELERLAPRVEYKSLAAADVIVKREVDSEWRGIDWLKKQVKIEPVKEARLIFVLPEFAESYEQAPADLVTRVKELARNGVCIILPRSTVKLEARDLRLMAALKKLQADPGVVSNIQYSRIIKTRRETAEAKVEQAVLRFGSAENLIFFVEGAQAPVNTLQLAVKYLFGKMYPDFPAVKMERISGRVVTNKVVSTLIASPGRSRNLASADQSEDGRFIRDAMPEMGLVEFRAIAGGSMATLSQPTPEGPGYKIWTAMDTALREHRSWDEFNRSLGGKPFGLPDYLRELYLAAYLASRKIAVQNTREGRVETAISPELVQSIVSQGSRAYKIFVSVGDTESLRPFVQDVWKLAEEVQGLSNHKIVKIETLGDLAVWHNSIRPALKAYATGRLDSVLGLLARIEALLPALGTACSVSDLRNLRNGLVDLATSTEHVTADSGYAKLLELCRALPGEAQPGSSGLTPDQAYYRFLDLDKQCDSMLSDEKASGVAVEKCLQAIHALGELSGSPIPQHRQADAKAAAAALAGVAADVLSLQARQEVVETVTRWWQGSVDDHITEHNIIVDGRQSCGSGLLGSTEFALLGALSALDFGLLKAGAIRTEIDGLRQGSCTLFASGQPFPQMKCPKCGEFYLRGQAKQELQQLAAIESKLGVRIEASLGAYLTGLRGYDSREGFQEYVASQPADAQETWGRFLLMDMEPAHRDNPALLGLAPRLVALVKGYLALRQKPREVRVPAERLATSFGEFLASRGVSEPTHDELVNVTQRWLTHVKGLFSR